MSIVLQDLPDNIAKEFSVNDSGHGFVSRRGIARLSGVHESSIRKLLRQIEGAGQNAKNRLPRMFNPFLGKAFEGANQIPDVLAALIIKYYARKGIEQAEIVDEALASVGLRVVIQSTLDWYPPRRLTEREIVEICCLPVASDWQPRFSVEFYDQFSRLTGLTPVKNTRPALWGKLTKEFVYDYMPKGVYEQVKAWQMEKDPNKKLHQFLSDQGVELLGEQLKRVITIMSCSSSITEARKLIQQSCTGYYQLALVS